MGDLRLNGQLRVELSAVELFKPLSNYIFQIVPSVVVLIVYVLVLNFGVVVHLIY